MHLQCGDSCGLSSWIPTQQVTSTSSRWLQVPKLDSSTRTALRVATGSTHIQSFGKAANESKVHVLSVKFEPSEQAVSGRSTQWQ
jgi:hypothetical protein